MLPHHLPSILSIRPSIMGTQDSYIWLPSKTGDYTAKTGYHIARSLLEKPADNHLSTINWNADIWLGQFSLKLKIFLWKITQKALPTGENLLNRGLFDSVCCIHCGELETTEHLFFLCEYARKVWALAPFSRAVDLSSVSFEASLKTLKSLVCLPPTGISSGSFFPWICWTIWSARNYHIFEERLFPPEETILKAIKDAREWHEAQIKVENQPPVRLFSNPHQRLHPETILCYTDGSWKSESEIAGAAWIFTTQDDTQIASGTTAEAFAPSPLTAEAIAIRSALIQALEMNFLHLQIKSDAQDLLRAITSREKIKEIHSLLSDITSLAQLFTSISFRFIPRSENSKADSLAKSAACDFVVGLLEPLHFHQL
ncbi:unnamed protein product [Microthlaspi erraticum]|uniref:Uncharacterized protein n=1 Tax=Microthlaspi erraticum TaxID=1685480 RepID=A0A6D2JWD4_9BRAS|nr:unnamed protein product [Microthlaspi erraticum]